MAGLAHILPKIGLKQHFLECILFQLPFVMRRLESNTLKNGGLLNSKLGQLWTNPNIGLKM